MAKSKPLGLWNMSDPVARPGPTEDSRISYIKLASSSTMFMFVERKIERWNEREGKELRLLVVLYIKKWDWEEEYIESDEWDGALEKLVRDLMETYYVFASHWFVLDKRLDTLCTSILFLFQVYLKRHICSTIFLCFTVTSKFGKKFRSINTRSLFVDNRIDEKEN